MMPFSGRRGFVLLEVLVSLAILGIALSMVMRSFTISLRAARMSENVSAAVAGARVLMEGWELNPPPKGASEGDVPTDERLFYKAWYEPYVPVYDNAPVLEKTRYAWVRPIRLEIYFRGSGGRERFLLGVDSALTGAERFTPEARRENGIGFDQ